MKEGHDILLVIQTRICLNMTACCVLLCMHVTEDCVGITVSSVDQRKDAFVLSGKGKSPTR